MGPGNDVTPPFSGFQQIRFPEALELKIRASILRGSSTNSSLRSSKEHSLTLCLKSPSHTRLLLRRLFWRRERAFGRFTDIGPKMAPDQREQQ